jgi:hypothetical protein
MKPKRDEKQGDTKKDIKGDKKRSRFRHVDCIVMELKETDVTVVRHQCY